MSECVICYASQVDMVVVGEDVAIETPGLAGRRGLAGTVLVHKVRQLCIPHTYTHIYLLMRVLPALL